MSRHDRNWAWAILFLMAYAMFMAWVAWPTWPSNPANVPESTQDGRNV